MTKTNLDSYLWIVFSTFLRVLAAAGVAITAASTPQDIEVPRDLARFFVVFFLPPLPRSREDDCLRGAFFLRVLFTALVLQGGGAVSELLSEELLSSGPEDSVSPGDSSSPSAVIFS
jgi:hypothetical protein